MARGINKVILIGNLGADPEVRYTPNNVAIANLSLATSEAWRDKTSGEMVEQTEWHRVVCYRRLAEIAGEYLRKGSKVYIEGRLRTRKWQDQQGQDRYTTEILADSLQMLDGRGSQANAGADFNEGRAQSSGYAGASDFGGSATHHAAPAAMGSASSHADNFDDDIPF